MRVVIPVQDKPDGFHQGHETIIEFGKTIGDVNLAIHYDLMVWNSYLLHGKNMGILPKQFDKMEAGIKRLDVNDLKNLKKEAFNRNICPYARLNEDKRQRLLEHSTNEVSLFKDQLILDRYVNRCICAVMRTHMRQKGGEIVVIRGPEVFSFFMNKFLLEKRSKIQTVIYPTIIKDPINKIKCQSTVSNLSLDMKEHLLELRTVIDDAKSFYKVGRNLDLEKELNISYEGRVWSIYDIAVWEGGFVDGRLEVTSFSFPTDSLGGTAIIEEVEYFA